MSPPSSTEEPGGNSLQQRLAAIFTERVTLFATLGVCLLVLVIVVSSRFDYPLVLPDKPPPPPPVDKDALRRMDFENPDVYRTYLEKDSVTYGVRRTTYEEMNKPFAYENSNVTRRLKVGAPPIETGMLRISADSQKLAVRQRKGTTTLTHLVLRIENKLDMPVAYRVETGLGVVEDACRGMAGIDHNGMVIAAKSAVLRTECYLRDGVDLHVTNVETMVLPPLGFYYVSRLFPPHLGMAERTALNHQIPLGEPCATVPQQTILIGMGKSTVSWRDVVDFYARHRCETYDFPVGYRAFAKAGQYKLPVSSRTLAPTTP
jgi:hypothetical protein